MTGPLAGHCQRGAPETAGVGAGCRTAGVLFSERATGAEAVGLGVVAVVAGRVAMGGGAVAETRGEGVLAMPDEVPIARLIVCPG